MQSEQEKEAPETARSKHFYLEPKFLVQLALLATTVIVSMSELRSNVNNLVAEMRLHREAFGVLTKEVAALRAEMNMVKDVVIVGREARK